MIISRTPFRISFFGGGTDYPAWFRRHGGAVLATTIDKYCYLMVRHLPPFFGHKYRLVYSRMEDRRSLEEIEHPAIREVLRFLGMERGVAIHHDGDLPARSGMGSSSAFTVGLLHALYALQGVMPGRWRLAEESILIEQERIGETVGCQDQILAAHGGFNQILFHPDGRTTLVPVTLAPERILELNRHLMLFYTGIARNATDVAGSYAARPEECKRQLRIMRDLVEEGVAVLAGGRDLRAFGELLHEGWMAKRALSAVVSNSRVDDLYARARQAGAIGGKLTGAGGGGFLLLFVAPELHDRMRERLNDLIHVPIRFERNGSQILFHDLERDYLREERIRDGPELAPFQALDALDKDDAEGPPKEKRVVRCAGEVLR